jgi:sugar lactone lactonase YvrE
MFRLSVLVVITLFGSVATGVAAQDASPVARHVGGHTIASFDAAAGQFSEGVAVAADGTVYASLSVLGQLVRVVPGQDGFEVVGSVAGLGEGDAGILGLAVDTDGAVYGAVVSANAEARGVWRFDVEAGTAERVPGTQEIAFPNAISIDGQGALYVTDSLGGAVWRVLPGGAAEQWVQHDLLMGAEVPIGANGIALDEAAGTIYVAVAARGTLVAIPIQADGSAGEPAIHTEFTSNQGFIGVDGVALDGAGNLYVAQPLANVVVRVSPDGTIAPVATVADGLDGPTSVAVGPGADGVKTLFIASWSDALGEFAPPDGEAGPSVVAITLDRIGHGRPAIGDW